MEGVEGGGGGRFGLTWWDYCMLSKRVNCCGVGLSRLE